MMATKKHQVRLIVVAMCILLTLRIVLWAGLNVTGFCWAEKRWLSDEEFKYRYIAKSFQVSQERGIEMSNESPNCCSVYVYRGWKSGWDGLLGHGRATITMHLKGRYPNVVLSKDSKPPFVEVVNDLSNCGVSGYRTEETIYK